MKKRTIISIIICLAITAGYLGVFFFFFTDTERQNWVFSIPFAALGIVFVYLLGNLGLSMSNHRINLKLKKELQLEKNLNSSLKANNEIIDKDLPIAIIIYNDDHLISYCNDYSKIIFQSSLLGKDLSFISQKILDNVIESKDKTFDLDIYGNRYSCRLDSKNKILYLKDITEINFLKSKIESTRPVVAVVSFDNLTNVLEDLSLERRTEILGRFYGALEKWKNKFNIFGFSSSSDKQVYLLNKKILDSIIKTKFDLTEEISLLAKELEVEVSLSMGIGINSDDYNILGNYSTQALDYANDRGGSQVVIYDGVNMEVFGGKTNMSERKSMVTMKNNSANLVELIKNASSVIIMPHANTDADALGSALGIYELVEKIGTPGKILLDLDDIDSTTEKIIFNADHEYIKLRQSIIEKNEVDSFFHGKTLLIIVDHHDVVLSPNKDVYKKASNIVIIDHHRITDRLEIKSKLEIFDNKASSSVEMVSELIEMSNIDVKIPPYIANVMLIGLLIDTNNFQYNTEARTFQTASYLTENGADSAKAKMYLRESVEDQIARAKLLEKVQIINNQFAVIRDEKEIVSRENLAKTAESLLNIDNIIAGFAIGNIDKKVVGISARSNGQFNVHQEMENFKGGGHFNLAAAQISDKNIDEVYLQLVSDLEHKSKGDGKDMNVILVSDIKKLGKKGDVVSVTPGYGNFLLSKGQAIEANASNLSSLSEQKEAEEKRLEEEYKVALKTKSLVETMIVTIKVKTGSQGKLFGSINTKQISDSLYEQHSINIDKKKISLLDDKVASLGTYDVQAKLHKDVVATFKINVIEEGETSV